MQRHHPHNPALAKIRKLLAKAEDPAATPAEAELYTAKAAELVAAYGIDEALAEPSRPTAVTDRRITLEAPYARDKAHLLATVASALRCRCVQVTRRLDSGTEIALHVFGHEADLERTELLFTSLLLQSATGMRRAPTPPGEHHAAFRRSWLAGFTAAVGRRLSQAERQAETEAASRRTPSGRSTAIVLADRSREVERALHEAYPRLRSSRSRTLSGSGGQAGYRAGERADLGGTRIGFAEPAALG